MAHGQHVGGILKCGVASASYLLQVLKSAAGPARVLYRGAHTARGGQRWLHDRKGAGIRLWHKSYVAVRFL